MAKFLSEISSRWVSLLSGIASVLILIFHVIVSIFDKDFFMPLQVILFVVGSVCLFVACYRVWKVKDEELTKLKGPTPLDKLREQISKLDGLKKLAYQASNDAGANDALHRKMTDWLTTTENIIIDHFTDSLQMFRQDEQNMKNSLASNPTAQNIGVNFSQQFDNQINAMVANLRFIIKETK